MAFLANLLPAIGGLLPGIVSTVGKVVGKLGSGDFTGAIGEVGKALSGGGAAEGAQKVVEAVAKGDAERRAEDERRLEKELSDRRKQEEFDRELENKRKMAMLEFEIEARKRQLGNRIHDSLPIWRGRGIPRHDLPPLRAPQQMVSSGEPLGEVDLEEIEYELPPLPKKRNRRRRRY